MLPEREDEPKKRFGGRRWFKAAAWILIPAAVLCAVWFGGSLLLPRLFNFDAVTRFFRYMGLKNKEDYGQIRYDSDPSNVIAGFGSGLIVADSGGMAYYDMEGNQKTFVQSSMDTPVLCMGEEACALYSPGGKDLVVMNEKGEVLLDEAMSGALLDVDVSDDGYLAAITVESGYKSVVTVRNPKQDPMYVFYSRTSYLNACAVSGKGSLLALAVLSELRGTYHTVITFLRTNEEISDLTLESDAADHADLGNQMVYDLRFLDATHLCAICQNQVVFLTTDGTVTRTISLSDKTILDYAFSAKGFAVMAFRSSRAEDQDLLMVLNPDGETAAELESPARIKSVSARGRYLALLTEASLEIYDKQLHSFYRTEDTADAGRVFARADGTAILASDTGTKLLIP